MVYGLRYTYGNVPEKFFKEIAGEFVSPAILYSTAIEIYTAV
jgi:hypothetical protein